MNKLKNGWDYEAWEMRSGGIGIPDTELIRSYATRRLPLPDDLLEKRKKHMQYAYKTCGSYTWVARLYDMDRAQVRRIINDLPNNP